MALAVVVAVAAGSAHAALADGVSLALSTNQVAYGQDVSMTATVTSDLGEPDGTIEFVNVDTGMPLNDPLGDTLNPVGDGATTTFTFDTSQLPIGTYNIQAQYTVDFLTSLLTGIQNMDSDVQSLSVGSTQPVKSPTVTSLLAPATVATGSPVTLAATVTRTDGSTGIPTGTVEFDDTTSGSIIVLGSAPVDTTGTATLPLPTLDQGAHTISAYYAGDSQDQASSSSTVLVTSNPPVDTRLKTTTGVVVSPATSASGDTVTITATIDQVGHAIQPPGNSVTFISDSQCGLNVNLGSAVLGTAPPGVTVAPNQAAIQTPAFGPCVYTITASYMGDVANQGSTGTASLTALGPRDVTQIAYSGDTSATWNHTANFAATITGMSGGPQVGKTVLFTLGTQSCSGTTDTNGFVQCQLLVTQTGAQTLTVSVPKDLFITGRSSTFNFNVAQQVTTLSTGYVLGLTGTTLSATLNAEGSPLANQPVTLSLGSESCGTLMTSSAGTVSCVVPPIVGQDTAALIASFAGTSQYAASSASSNITVIFPTALSYTGATAGVFGGSATLSGVLMQTNTNTRLSSRPVTFSLGAQQCTATTDATGAASCTIQPIAADSGSYSVQASYGGDAITKPSNASASFSVTRAPTATAATAPTAGVSTTSLSAVLTTGGLPVAGKALLLTLGSNACTATTDSTGTATCSVTTPGGGAATYTATFATDADYTGSNDTKNVILPTTSLLYSGATTAVFNSPATLTAQLTKLGDGSAVSGRVLTFTLGAQQCTATTASNGVASCTIGAVTADAGTITLAVNFTGDAGARPSSLSLPFIVTLAPTVTTATTVNAGFTTTTLNATLTSGGAAVPGKAMTLTLGGNSCLGSTDATGTATCAVSTPVAPAATFTAAFAGDADYAASSDTKTVALPVPTTLAYTGATTAVFNGSATLSGVLTATGSGSAVSGKPVTFTLGAQQCSTTTGPTGVASCTVQPVTASPGSLSVIATFAGDTSTRPSTASATFAVTSATTTTAAAAPTAGSSTTTLSATLTSAGSPLNGKTLTLALGGNTCSAPTDATGAASCSVTTPNGGTATYTATFAGDTSYSGSSDSRQVILPTTALAYTGGTTAVYNSPTTVSAQLTKVGDGSAVASAAVLFTLGSQTCQGMTDTVGVATCTIPAVTVDPGSTAVLVSFAGDGSNRASTTSASFTVTRATSTTTAAAPTAGTATTTLSATLTSGGSPLGSKPMTLSLGGNTCTATTDSTGAASCSVTTPGGATATYTATFPGDADFAASSDSKAVVLPATTLLYSGATTAAFNGSATLTALLSKTGDGTAVSGRVVSLTLGTQSCQGTTGPTGVATCTIAAVTAHAGTTTVGASFAGDAVAGASSTSAPFTVTLAPTTTVAATATVGFTTTSLSATLASGTTPLAGKQLTLTLGSNSCLATTGATGTATCSVATPIASSAQYTAAFAGDAGYAASTGAKTVTLPTPTTLTYTGATTVAYNGSTTLSALLTQTDGVTPVGGKSVNFGFGTLHCTGTTDATGRATCTVQPVTAAAGSYTVGASFAGDSSARPSGTSAPFTVTLAPTTTVALTPTVGSPTTTLSATLASGSSFVAGKAMTLALGGNACTGTTDATGTATCAVTTPDGDTATYTATFAGDGGYAASSDSKSVTLVAPTTLVYTGATTATFNGSATLSAKLTKNADGSALASRPVSFSLGSQTCQATTDTAGVASCAIQPVAQDAGSLTVGASYAGDPITKPASASAAFTITLAPTTTVAATPAVGATTTPLSATLTSGGTPLAGKPMTLALGANSCSATTDASGVATCSANTPTGASAQYVASFAGDADYASSNDTKTVTLIVPTALAYTGATTAVYNGSAALTAKLTLADGSTPLNGRTVSFMLGAQTCQGTTSATGAATCTIPAVSGDAGSYTVAASYAGDALTKPATSSAPFTVTLAPTATFAAPPTVGSTTTSLSATLTTAGTSLANTPMTLTLGTNSCLATTGANGVATCSVATPSGSSAQYTARFAGNADYAASSGTLTVTLLAPTTLNFLGLRASHYDDPTILSAILTGPSNVPLSGQTVTFRLGSQSCNAMTVLGVAACTLVVTQPAGTYPVTVSFAGNATYAATTDTDTFTVTPEQTTLTATAPAAVQNGGTAAIGGTLLEDGIVPVPGRTLTLTLGTKSCTATTNASGVGTCSVAVTGALGPAVATASFTGDAYYVPASASTSTIEYASLSGGGSFVIGDRSTSGTVTFWGSQWSKSNSLSGGSAPSSFKGFASSPTSPRCGGTWSSGPGSSPKPPSGPLPAYMAVVVTSSSAKSGSAITGNITSVVVVKTNAGYDANPGHAGTGTVVATVC